MIVYDTTSIIEAMAKINENARGAVIVCDNKGVVIATLTDGDIRRHILSGGRLDAPVIGAANKEFYYIAVDDKTKDAHKICVEKNITMLPVLDSEHRLVSIYFKDEIGITIKPRLEIPVVIMAGGKGTRLYPYTKVLPKPLIPIGEHTITEHIMARFEEYGCDDFIMIVNHKKNMLKAYFADTEPVINIRFIDEDIPLGTGGGLKLIEGLVDRPFFMTNCDVLVFADYSEMIKTHNDSRNIITLVCVTKTFTIPYGTVELDNVGAVSALTEKPSFSFLTNTGFYIIDPKFLKYINPDSVTHITETIQRCIEAGERIGIFPISEEQWSDMGQLDEMEKMRKRLLH